MQNAFLSVLDDLAARAPRSDAEYLGEDGLMRCYYCHTPTQCVIPWGDSSKRVVPCLCQCKTEDREREAQRDEELRRHYARMRCFEEPRMAKCTFAADDRSDDRISEAMRRYVERFDEFRTSGKGLLLFGSVGTGKSFYAACIANALIDQNRAVRMRKMATIINEMQGSMDGKNSILDKLTDCSLLIIDDLGADSGSEFRKEVTYSVIDRRYCSGLPMIVTTNLTADALKKPQDIGYQRIYDRILERCFPIEITGQSRRRQALRENFAEMKDALGL